MFSARGRKSRQQQMQAKRRRPALGDAAEYGLEEGPALGIHLASALDPEAGRLEQRTHLVRRREKAGRAVVGPGRRVDHLAARTPA